MFCLISLDFITTRMYLKAQGLKEILTKYSSRRIKKTKKVGKRLSVKIRSPAQEFFSFLRTQERLEVQHLIALKQQSLFVVESEVLQIHFVL